MREILFRGKRIDNGEWVEGRNILIVRNERSNRKYFVAQTDTPCATFESEEHSGVFVSTPTFRLIPETVGQYTGLTDKNGKKIFEGDIVKDDPRETEVVKYEGGGFAPFAIPNWECTPDAEWVEVIGNIHDNPELIGGDK